MLRSLLVVVLLGGCAGTFPAAEEDGGAEPLVPAAGGPLDGDAGALGDAGVLSGGGGDDAGAPDGASLGDAGWCLAFLPPVLVAPTPVMVTTAAPPRAANASLVRRAAVG